MDDMESGDKENGMTPPTRQQLDNARSAAASVDDMEAVKFEFDEVHKVLNVQRKDMAHSAKLHTQARHTVHQTLRALTKAEEMQAQRSFTVTGLKFSASMKHEDYVKGYQQHIEQHVRFPPKCQDDINKSESTFMGYRDKALNTAKKTEGPKKDAPIAHCKIGFLVSNKRYVDFLDSYFYEQQEGGKQQLQPLYEEGKERLDKGTAEEQGGKPFLLHDVRIQRTLPTYAEEMCKYTGQIAFKMRKHKKNIDKKNKGYMDGQKWMEGAKINTVGTARQHIVIKRPGSAKNVFVPYDELQTNDLTLAYCPRDPDNKAVLARQPLNVVGRAEEIVFDEVNFKTKATGGDVYETDVAEMLPDSPNTLKAKQNRKRAQNRPRK